MIRRLNSSIPNRDTVFYVEYGDADPPHFNSIFGLINYYDSFGYLKHNYTDNGLKLDIEVFPLWNCPKENTTTLSMSSLSSYHSSKIPNDSIFDSTITISTSPSTSTK